MSLSQTLLSTVVLGTGFTPAVFGEKVLRDVFAEPPTTAVATPPLALLRYPGGFEVLVRDDRIEVKCTQKSDGTAREVLRKAILAALQSWPLLVPRAVGLNYGFSMTYGEGAAQNRLAESLIRVDRLAAIVKADVTATELAFSFEQFGAVVTARVSLGANVDEQPSAALNFNVHIAGVESSEGVAHAMDRDAEFTNIVRSLAEGLFADA